MWPAGGLHPVREALLYSMCCGIAQQVQHTADNGWERPKIVPFGPLQLHPAAQVLHYGTCCFEGMKAYLGPDGKGLLFR